jgi:thiol-disulfide isomerase/thioredoxin
VRRLICAIILISLFGCNSNKNTGIVLKKGKAVIAGKVQNFTDSSRVLRFAADGVVERIEQTAILDSLGNFRIEIELFNPQNVNLIYENNYAYLYLEQGDSLFLNIDADLFKKDGYAHYEVSGINSNTSKNIRDYFQFHNPFTYEPQWNITTKEFLNDLKIQIEIEDSVLDKFIKKENPTNKFVYWAQNDIRYSLANYLISYFAYYDMHYKQYKSNIFNTDMFPVDKDPAIVSSSYTLHLSNYAVAKYISSDTICAQLIKEKDIKNAYRRVFDNIIKNEKPGLSRDIMIYKIFYAFCSRRSINYSMDSKEAIWKSYKKDVNNPVLIKAINDEMSSSKNQANKNDDSLYSNFGLKFKSVGKFLKILHSKHIGKIIYIDIWATWCVPCRGEIPYEIELQGYFKDRPVAFANLCLSSDKADWKKVILENHIKGDNYFFNEDQTALFRGDLKFAGYPTYMIMDRKGNLIDKNAARPSSGAVIRNILNKLINQQ